MKEIIVISGKQYCGKDTLAKILLDKLTNYKRVGIGDAIKLEYASQKNLTLDEIEKNKHLYRSDLIDLGNKGRDIDPDYWLLKISKMSNIIVPDLRVIHELEFFKSKGAFLIRVEADEKIRSNRGILVKSQDPTETMLDNYNDWNFIVYNNGTFDDLKIQADKIVAFLA